MGARKQEISLYISYFEHTTNNLIYLKMGKGEGWGEGQGEGAGEAEFKNGLIDHVAWNNNFGTCVFGYCCLPCLFKRNAEKMGENGMLHCIGGCCIPILPAFMQLKKLREDNNIDGDMTKDILAAVCCAPCAAVQVANELEHLGK